MSARRVELFELLFLLGLVALFYFVVVPAGISDPDGFVLDEGLPPSFSARLIAILAAMIIVLRVLRITIFSPRAVADEPGVASEVEPVTELSTKLTRRVWTGVVISLFFAFALVPVLGFAIASLLTLGTTLFVLGERSWFRLMLYPLLVSAGVWLLFSQLLSVKLPEGLFIPVFIGG